MCLYSMGPCLYPQDCILHWIYGMWIKLQLQLLNWNQCSSLRTDGASSMYGAHQNFIARLKEVNQKTFTFHCLLDRENLTPKRVSHELDAVPKEVNQIVYFMKARSLNCRILNYCCFHFIKDHTHLLHNSEVRWLSTGNLLKRLV
jgi:hypothetical protein